MQVASGLTPQAAAQGAGVCPRTVRKWAARYAAEGVAGGTGTIVCYIAVSAETRRSVAELVPMREAQPSPMPRRDAPPIVLPDFLRKEAAAAAMLSYTERAPWPPAKHSADSHDGHDDGVDLLGRSLLVRLFIAGRVLADADV